MTKNKTGRISLVFIFAFLSISINAQGIKQNFFSFEMGFNYPVVLRSGSNQNSKVGVYFEGLWNFKNSPLSIESSVNLERYTVKDGSYDNGAANTLALIPFLIYNCNSHSKIHPYFGLGTGVTVDNPDSGVFSPGYHFHFDVVPKVGVRVCHIDAFSEYYITKSTYTRLVFGLGYTF